MGVNNNIPLEELQVSALVLDTDYRVISLNHHAEHALGFSADELLGRCIDEIIELQASRELLSLRFTELSGTIRRKSGITIPVHIKRLFKLDHANTITISLTPTTKEATTGDEELADEADAQSRLQNDGVTLQVDQIPAPLIFLNGDHLVVGWNKGCERILGFSRNHMVNESINVIFTDLDAKSQFEVLFERAAGRAESARTVIECSAQGSKKLLIEFTAQSVRSREGDLVGVAFALNDITQYEKTSTTLQNRLMFEELIMTMTTYFLNLEPDEINNGINDALQIIGEFIGADRASLIQFMGDGTSFDKSHEWCDEGKESHMKMLRGIPSDVFTWWIDRLRKFDTIQLSRLSELPSQAQQERDILDLVGINSLLAVPIFRGKNLLGWVSFDSDKPDVPWTNESVQLLKVVGEVFVSALEKRDLYTKQSTAQLLNNYFLVNSSDLVLEVNPRGDITNGSAELIRRLDLDLDSLLGRNVDSILHLKDTSVVLDTFYSESKEDLHFRFVSHNGSWIWCVSKGFFRLSKESFILVARIVEKIEL